MLQVKLNLTCQCAGGYWPPSGKNDGNHQKQPFKAAHGFSRKTDSANVLHHKSSHHNTTGLHHHISAAQRYYCALGKVSLWLRQMLKMWLSTDGIKANRILSFRFPFLRRQTVSKNIRAAQESCCYSPYVDVLVDHNTEYCPPNF